MSIQDKNDYLNLGLREDIHLTVREDILEDFKILSIKWRQPMGKILDCLFLDLMKDPNKIKKLYNDVRNYR